MGLPDIVIEFTKKAIATISVGTGGLVGIIVKDAKSKKTFAEVPAVLKDKVKEILIDLELPELAE